MNVYVAFRAQLDSGLLRAWSGPGELTIDEPFTPEGVSPGGSATFRPGAALLAGAAGRLAFGMDGDALVGTPVVGRVVDVFSIGEDDDGRRVVLPFVRRGLLDNPTLQGGAYTVSVTPRAYPKPTELWSHEAQARLHPGDALFSQQRALAKGIEGIHFPDVPNFDPQGEYDGLVIQRPPTDESRRGVGDPDDGLPGNTPLASPGIIAVGRRVAARGRLGGWAGPRGS